MQTTDTSINGSCSPRSSAASRSTAAGQHLERVARQACPRSAPCAAPTCADYPHCDAPREVRTCRR